MILFLISNGKKKGQGNFFRSSSIASKLNKNFKVFLVCANTKLVNKFKVSQFDKIYDSKKNLEKIIIKHQIKIIIFDGYKLNTKIKNLLNNYEIRTMQINYDPKSFSEIKINQLYTKNKKNTYNYYIVREEIINKYKNYKYSKYDKILFSFGSSFQNHQLKFTLKLIKNHNLKNYSIILPNKEFLKKKYFKNINLKNLFINPGDKLLRKIYKNNNIGFTSGGLQLSEMIANRMMVFSFPKNNLEKKNCLFFKNQGFCIEIKKNDFNKFDKITNKLKVIFEDKKLRRKIELNIIKNFRLDGLKKTKNLITKCVYK